MDRTYTPQEIEALQDHSFDAGYRLGGKDAQNAIAHLLETQADRYAPHDAAVWLRALAGTIRRGEWR